MATMKRKESDRGMKTVISKTSNAKLPEPKDTRLVPTSKSAPKILQLSKSSLMPSRKADESHRDERASPARRESMQLLTARQDRQSVEALSAFVSVQSKRTGVEVRGSEMLMMFIFLSIHVVFFSSIVLLLFNDFGFLTTRRALLLTRSPSSSTATYCTRASRTWSCYARPRSESARNTTTS
jgi:hypothetical protein